MGNDDGKTDFFHMHYFLASQDALEVMGVTYWSLAHLIDVTLVSEDPY